MSNYLQKIRKHYKITLKTNYTNVADFFLVFVDNRKLLNAYYNIIIKN